MYFLISKKLGRRSWPFGRLHTLIGNDTEMTSITRLVVKRSPFFDKVAGKGQQQYYWTEAVQVTNTDGRPDLSSEGVPDIVKTVNVKR
jgi:hypothetical protein